MQEAAKQKMTNKVEKLLYRLRQKQESHLSEKSKQWGFIFNQHPDSSPPMMPDQRSQPSEKNLISKKEAELNSAALFQNYEKEQAEAITADGSFNRVSTEAACLIETNKLFLSDLDENNVTGAKVTTSLIV